MSRVEYCVKCGAHLAPSAKFCISCGTPVPSLSSRVVKLSSVKRAIWLAIGVVILLFSLTFLSLGIAGIVTPQEVWRTKTTALYDDETVRQPGWQKDYWIHPYVAIAPALSPGESRDFVITGSIQEVQGRIFSFYIFNSENYEYWKAKMPYKAYVETRGESKYVFQFMATKDDYDKLRFVTQNLNPDLNTPDLVFKVSATMTWEQRSASAQIADVATGIFTGAIGLVLLIPALLILYHRVIRTRRGLVMGSTQTGSAALGSIAAISFPTIGQWRFRLR